MRRTRTLAVLVGVLGLGCGKKAKECDGLITSMNDLGNRVSVAQRAADQPDAKPADLIAVLTPLAKDAGSLAAKLRKESPTTTEVRALADEFAKFSTDLANEATKIAAASEKLATADAIAEALEHAQKDVDKAQAELERYCTANPTVCVSISEPLTKLPAGPSSADDGELVAQWRKALGTWLASFTALPIEDATLKKHLDDFSGAWTRVGEKMVELSALTNTAREVEAAGKRFDSLIDQANLVITRANRECGREEKK